MGQVAEDPGAPSVFVACHGRPDVLSSLCVACASCVRTCVDVTRLCAGTFPENPASSVFLRKRRACITYIDLLGRVAAGEIVLGVQSCLANPALRM